MLYARHWVKLGYQWKHPPTPSVSKFVNVWMGVSRPDMTLTTQEAGGKDRITPEQQRE
jgi:hypothetical protein